MAKNSISASNVVTQSGQSVEAQITQIDTFNEPVIENRAPTPSDTDYPIGKKWLDDSASPKEWYIYSGSGVWINTTNLNEEDFGALAFMNTLSTLTTSTAIGRDDYLNFPQGCWTIADTTWVYFNICAENTATLTNIRQFAYNKADYDNGIYARTRAVTVDRTDPLDPVISASNWTVANFFTTALKNKLDGISEGATRVSTELLFTGVDDFDIEDINNFPLGYSIGIAKAPSAFSATLPYIVETIRSANGAYQYGRTEQAGMAFVSVRSHNGTLWSTITDDYIYTQAEKNKLGNYPEYSAVETDISNKQDTLASGTNIKTINSQDLLGSGNLSIDALPFAFELTSADDAEDLSNYPEGLSAGTYAGVTFPVSGIPDYQTTGFVVCFREENSLEIIVHESGTGNQIYRECIGGAWQVGLEGRRFAPNMATKLDGIETQATKTNIVDETKEPVANDAQVYSAVAVDELLAELDADISIVTTDTAVEVQSSTGTSGTILTATATDAGVMSGALFTKLDELPDNTTLTGLLDDKQDTLVSGANIKTVNGESIVGSGNIEITTAQAYINAYKAFAQTGVTGGTNVGIGTLYNAKNMAVSANAGFNLVGGETYEILCSVACSAMGQNFASFSLVDYTTNNAIAPHAKCVVNPPDRNASESSDQIINLIYTPTADQEIVLRCTGGNCTVRNELTTMTIKKLS